MCGVISHALTRANLDRFRERVAIREVKHYPKRWSILVGSCIECGQELRYFLSGAELARFMEGAIVTGEPRREIGCGTCGGALFHCDCGIGQSVKGLPGLAKVTNVLAVQPPGARA